MFALRLIFKELKRGEQFGNIMEHRLGGTFFWTVLSMSPDGMYIRWTDYGSSANKATLKELKWILSEIFKTTPEEFLLKHSRYSDWKQIDKCYKDAR